MPDALIVDDHEATATALAALARKEGFEVAVSSGLDEARAHLARHPVDVILLDLKLPDGDGLSLLDGLDADDAPAVVLITGEASLQSAVDALRRGVSDYLTKPVDTTRLKSILGHVAQSSGLGRELRQMSAEADTSRRFGEIIGASPSMREVFRLISRVAPSSASVLITGESGTGKEVVARTIHDVSRRRNGPFVAVNCGAITPTLMESELFGHERGAFTGAERRHHGMFERAHQGTLFLDEITEMPPELQVKFLRVLETGIVRRLGGEETQTVDVRVLAATNRPPEEAVEKGKLRQDLYYRLKVFHMMLAPLRERTEDVEPLVEHFLARLAEREGQAKTVTPATLAALQKHTWPGNVRELRNVLYSAYVLAEKDITPDTLPPEVRSGVPPTEDGDTVVVQVGTPLADAERRIILATLASLGGNKTRTAETLGISLKTLYARLADYKARTTEEA
ncbi:MAG: sigma-54 dependent transcriptional regulator [Vicinamibacterales bacterium]